MNDYRNDLALKGAEFLDKKYLNNIKKQHFHTSSTGKTFSGIKYSTNAALIQH